MLSYTFNDHIHNYAVWTAAKAVQRKFTKTVNIKTAIEATDLKNFVSNNSITTDDQFDFFHRRTAYKIIETFEKLGVNASYGQAAKMIAIYLKTSVIIRDSGQSQISKIAHPPIDNILLTGLHKRYPNLITRGIKWTQLNETKYFDLINRLRTLNLDSFWELEVFWNPS